MRKYVKHALFSLLAFIAATAMPAPCADDAGGDKTIEEALDDLNARAEYQPQIERAKYLADHVLSLPGAEEELNRLVQMDSISEKARNIIEIDRKRAVKLRKYRDDIYAAIVARGGELKAPVGFAAAWYFLTPAMTHEDIGISYFKVVPEKEFSFAYTIDGDTMMVTGRIDELGRTLSISCHVLWFKYDYRIDWPDDLSRELRNVLSLARAMHVAEVDDGNAWRIMRTHDGILAAEIADDEEMRIFYRDELHAARRLDATEYYSLKKSIDRMELRLMTLVDSMDASIDPAVRKSLRRILLGARGNTDARDQLSQDFCRRLVESGYLESVIDPVPPEISEILRQYRLAMGKLRNGRDSWTLALPDGMDLTCVEFGAGNEPGREEAGSADASGIWRTVSPAYGWRIESAGRTAFSGSMPGMLNAAMFILDYYSGRNSSRPGRAPDRTEIRHPEFGLLGRYDAGAERMEVDADLWEKAAARELGDQAWKLPPHAVVRDGSGGTLLLALPGGTVPMPVFSSSESAAPDREKDAWLDRAAAVMSAPAELGLLFPHMFQYVFDSPKSGMPKLIGTHDNYADTHQTVSQTLDRLAGGRLLGDCDDVAEFYLDLTRRQGKPSYVLQVGPPPHAVAGYVEKRGNGEFCFNVLQSGLPERFIAPTAGEAVEAAYRHFNPSDGQRAERTDLGVSVLLRFPGESVRRLFVLPRSIFTDEAFGQEMIQVQEYLYGNLLSRAEKAMDGVAARHGRTLDVIRELAGIYTMTGQYQKANSQYGEAYALAGDDALRQIGALSSMLANHVADSDREAALAVGLRIDDMLRRLCEGGRIEEVQRLLVSINQWAIHMAYLGRPFDAWCEYKYGYTVFAMERQRVSENIMEAMVSLYEEMQVIKRKRDLDEAEIAMWRFIEQPFEEVFTTYFLAGDAPDETRARYVQLGRFAVAKVGREEGLRLLKADFSADAGKRRHWERKQPGLMDEDWDCFRRTPELYEHFAREMMDAKFFPDTYDLEAAGEMIGLAKRALAGSDSSILTAERLAMLETLLCVRKNDFAGFSAGIRQLASMEYELYRDEAAVMFGYACESVDPAVLPDWLEEYRKAFPAERLYLAAVYQALRRKAHDQAIVMCDAGMEFFPEESPARRELEHIRLLAVSR